MRGRSRAVAACVASVLTAGPVGAVAGCTTTATTTAQGTSAGSGPTTRCGTAHTAAGVPVGVEVHGEHADCRAAMAVERAYTRAIVSGKVPGNGGGAPVTIRGWICQGFNTPQVLATGHASACRKNGTVILAVLPTPSPHPS